MAIVQISKIIHRTGANVDLPQLDVGEIGYANDDRRVYIGDDSVLHPPATEGETTQTEILTEHSTLSFSKIGGTSNTSLELSDVKTGQLLVATGNATVGNVWSNWDGNRIGPDNQKLILGTPSNLKITGGSNGQFLQTDGTGNLVWTDSIGQVTISGAPGGSSAQLQFNDAGNFGGSAYLTFDKVQRVFTVTGNATITGNITGNTLGDHNGTIGADTPNSGAFTTIVTTSSITAGGNLTAANIITDGNLSVTSNLEVGNLYSAGTANVGNLIVTGNVSSSLIPEPTEMFDLGDADNRWQNAYIAGEVFIGDHSLSQDGDSTVLSGNLMVDNADLGNSAVANYFTGTLTTAAQPNITSLGRLSSLRVDGVTNLGNIANIIITGGSNNFVLGTNGFGNLRWVPNTELLRKPSGQNTYIQFNDNGDFGAIANLVFDKTTGTMGVINIATTGNVQTQGNTLTNNLTSNGNINGNVITAVTRFSGPGLGLTNIPGGNVTGTVGNATTATFAGTVTTAAQPNVTSVGTLTSLAVNGMITAPNITISSTTITTKFQTGTIIGNLVPDADLVNNLGNSTRRWKDLTLGGVANVAGNVNAGNISATTGIFTTVAGTLSTAAQPNVTSLGTLTGLDVNGLVNAGYLQGDGSNIVNIPGANVQGEVSYAVTANSVDISNVAGIGNIASINLDGNSSNILYGDGTFAAAPSGSSSYADSNVVTLLGTFGSNAISTTGDVSVGNLTAESGIVRADIVTGNTLSSNSYLNTNMSNGAIAIQNAGGNGYGSIGSTSKYFGNLYISNVISTTVYANSLSASATSNLTLTAGANTSGGVAGNIVITSGSASGGATAQSGDIRLTTPDVMPAGQAKRAGNIVLTAGVADNAGHVNITAGANINLSASKININGNLNLGSFDMFSNINGIFFRNVSTQAVYSIALTPV